MIQFLKDQFRMLYLTDRTWMIREKLYWQFICWKIAPEAIRSLVKFFKYSYGCIHSFIFQFETWISKDFTSRLFNNILSEYEHPLTLLCSLWNSIFSFLQWITIHHGWLLEDCDTATTPFFEIWRKKKQYQFMTKY